MDDARVCVDDGRAGVVVARDGDDATARGTARRARDGETGVRSIEPRRAATTNATKCASTDHRSRWRRARRLFYSYFKTLVGKPVVVELKNDLAIEGTLVSVDQYLNIKLEHTRVTDEARYPHMRSVRNCFIRGSVVRYVQLPKDAVDVDILHDATRREARGA